MALQFCEHDDVVFSRAPLVTVLCQVQFPPVLSLMTSAGVTGFQQALRDTYPTFLPGTRNARVALSDEAIGVQAGAPIWRLTDSEAQWTVGLAANFVSLESPSYTNIDEFLERFTRITNVLRRTIRPADSVRVGMRKVNHFQIDGPTLEQLTHVVRPELLGPLSVNTFPRPIGAYLANLAFEDEDNALVLRYGLELEPEIRFVLDMDYFTERPHEVNGDATLIQLLRHFSDGMTSFFHWAVNDEYKLTLGPEQREERQTTP